MYERWKERHSMGVTFHDAKSLAELGLEEYTNRTPPAP
jgi:hypothetical protein